MNITEETKVGEIAAHHPMATRVFSKHGIDFCCRGGAPLRTVCERRGRLGSSWERPWGSKASRLTGEEIRSRVEQLAPGLATAVSSKAIRDDADSTA